MISRLGRFAYTQPLVFASPPPRIVQARLGAVALAGPLPHRDRPSRAISSRGMTYSTPSSLPQKVDDQLQLNSVSPTSRPGPAQSSGGAAQSRRGAKPRPTLFSTFDVTEQVFYRSEVALGIVNLKPIVPGHVLVIPRRAVPRLLDLSPGEAAELFRSVHEVCAVVERAYAAEGLTVSCQDGRAAGQTVPHVHVHILPRRSGDFEPNDLIYEHLESFGLSLFATHSTSSSSASPETAPGAGAGTERSTLKVDADEDRRPRGKEEMGQEARWLSRFFEVSN